MKTNLENYEERFVDYMEGQLDAIEMKEVEAFVAQHPELEEDFKLFCSTKLVPDTEVVFTKKESLLKPATTVRPLFVRILAAAACVALLIGIGIRFLKPHQTPDQQPLLAELAPVKANVAQEMQELKKSNLKVVTVPKTLRARALGEPVSEPTEMTQSSSEPAIPETIEAPEQLMASAEPEKLESIAPIELIAAVSPIQPKPLERQEAFAYDEVEISMFVELGARLSTVDPIALQEPIALRPWDGLFDNVQETTKNFYKRTAKTVMSAYYRVDYHFNEAKDQLMAAR